MKKNKFIISISQDGNYWSFRPRFIDVIIKLSYILYLVLNQYQHKLRIIPILYKNILNIL